MTPVRHYLTDDATKTLAVSLVLSRIDYCNSLSAGLPQSLVGKLQRVQNCAARLVAHVPPHIHITPVLRHLHWLPVRDRVSYKTAGFCFNAITFYICTLLLDLFAPEPTPASSKFHSINARQKVIVLSLTLVLLSGTHCHCTLEMLELSTPSSLLSNPISSTSKNLISSCLPDLLCVSVCGVYVCVCVCVCGC